MENLVERFKEVAKDVWNTGNASIARRLDAAVEELERIQAVPGLQIQGQVIDKSILKRLVTQVFGDDFVIQRQVAAEIPLPNESQGLSWVSVTDGLPPVRDKDYRVLAICNKQYDENSNYPGQGIMRVMQDWNVRMWPQNFSMWQEIALPTDSASPSAHYKGKIPLLKRVLIRS
jgi:hypothetical protein